MQHMNQSHATDLFLHPLKTSENQSFSDVFGRYRKRPYDFEYAVSCWASRIWESIRKEKNYYEKHIRGCRQILLLTLREFKQNNEFLLTPKIIKKPMVFYYIEVVTGMFCKNRCS